MEERTYLVYKHTSPSNKVYIGITKQTAEGRWKNGFGYQSSPHFWNAIQKYGWDAIEHEVLFDGLTEEDACKLEQQLIKDYDSINPLYGYNQKSGGQLGSSMNDDALIKLKESLKRFYAEHPEARKRIADRVTGFHHTEESKEKMRVAKQGRHFMQTEEWRRHIGEANKRKILSDSSLYEDICARCRDNGKKRSVPVIQLDLDDNFIAQYESATEAQRQTGAKNCNIVMCCKGLRHTANGYKWQFAAQYNSSSETA